VELFESLGLALDPAEASIPTLMLDPVPHADYEPDEYQLRSATPSRLLRDGDPVGMGEYEFTVLSLPGHSAGSIGLFDERPGLLFFMRRHLRRWPAR
jgi:glyoxylase-like metal-dependent hydrolase (beta-lactamase superfamily II)